MARIRYFKWKRYHKFFKYRILKKYRLDPWGILKIKHHSCVFLEKNFNLKKILFERTKKYKQNKYVYIRLRSMLSNLVLLKSKKIAKKLKRIYQLKKMYAKIFRVVFSSLRKKNVYRIPRRKSLFGKMLIEKKKFQFFYRITQKKLIKIIKKTKKINRSSFISQYHMKEKNFFSFFERRFDMIILRLGFSFDVLHARLQVKNGCGLINNRFNIHPETIIEIGNFIRPNFTFYKYYLHVDFHFMHQFLFFKNFYKIRRDFSFLGLPLYFIKSKKFLLYQMIYYPREYNILYPFSLKLNFVFVFFKCFS